MITLKPFSPTGSYILDLPEDVVEQAEDAITSFWRAGGDFLLQLSSHVREHGMQVGSRARLQARLDHAGALNATTEHLQTPNCPDCAAASVVDPHGTKWIYFYAVWPDLMVFATVSGPARSAEEQGSWAVAALRALRRH